jgi:hypothetical protein
MKKIRLYDICGSMEMKVNKVYSDVVNLKIYRKTPENEPISTSSRHKIN